MIGIAIGNYVGNQRVRYWTQAKIAATFLFWGETSKITGGKLYNQVTGRTSEYLTVAGSAGSETYQVPNTADYKTADTDKIWFKYAANIQRTVTTTELIGYDFPRTIIKYDNTSPYTIRIIAILKSGVVLTTSESNHLRDYFDLSLWWDNTLSLHGNLKGNRGTGQNVFTKEASTLLTGLLNYFKFDEVSGACVDVVSANNGTVTGATQNVTGKINKCVSFDGSDSIALTSAHTFLTTQSLTIAFWAKCNSIATSEYFLDRTAVVNSIVSFYKVNADLSFRIRGSNAAGSTIVTWAGILTTGWTHIVGVRNVSTDRINLYVNGVPYGTPVTDATTANLGALTLKLGADAGASLPYTGLMDELGVWTKALSDAEVLELYNSGAGNQHPF